MPSNTLQKYVRQLPAQHDAGCCTANASLIAAEMMMSDKFAPLSRLYVYYMARKVQDRLNRRGVELKATLNALMEFGTCQDRYWPFGSSRVNLEPSEQARIDALNYRLDSFLEIGIDEFKNSIDAGISIIIGIQTGRMFWKLAGPLTDQAYVPVNSLDNRQSYGHAVTVVGYDDNLGSGSWIIANSLGLKWGDNGYGAIPYSCQSDIREAYIMNGFAGIIPEEKFLRFDK